MGSVRKNYKKTIRGTYVMKKELKKLVCINLVLFMMLGIVFLPLFTISVEATENNVIPNAINKTYKDVLIVDGNEYDATKNHSGDGWSYDYHDNFSATLNLSNYNGGGIYCSYSLDINISIDSVNKITSSSSVGIESLGIIHLRHAMIENSEIISAININTSGFPAVKAKEVYVDGPFVAMSTNSAALIANKIKLSRYEPSKIYVGTSASNAMEGMYTNQSYVSVDPIEYKLNFNGNGGTTTDGETTRPLIFNGSYSALVELNNYKNIFSNHDKIQLGWTKIQNDYDQLILLTDYYRFIYKDFEDDLYAVWTNDSLKAITLSGYVDVRLGIIDKIVPCNTNQYFTLPNSHKSGCKFEGWQTEDGSKIYLAGESIIVKDNIYTISSYY